MQLGETELAQGSDPQTKRWRSTPHQSSPRTMKRSWPPRATWACRAGWTPAAVGKPDISSTASVALLAGGLTLVNAAILVRRSRVTRWRGSPAVTAATKAAIANFSAGLAQLLGPRRIRVNSVVTGGGPADIRRWRRPSRDRGVALSTPA